MKAILLSKTNLKPLLLLAIVLAGCDGGRFVATNLKTELAPEVMQVSKTCEEFFISNYGGVAAVVNGKDYVSEISQNRESLETLVKACDNLMTTAPYGECRVEVSKTTSFLINDKNFENTCLDASVDLEKLNKSEVPAVVEVPVVSPSVPEVSEKYCSDDFVRLYEGVEKIVSDKDYSSEIKTKLPVLKNLVKACDALMFLSPNGGCKIKQSSSGTVISDFDFESVCLDAAEDLIKANSNPVVASPIVDNPPAVASTPQVLNSKDDILKKSVNFELRTTNPAAFATLINSQKQRDHYILFFVGGTRLTQSPTAAQIGIGCSVYTTQALVGADLAKPIRLERKSVKPIASGVIVLFEMNANSKKLNIQCFKRVTEKNSTFTLADIAKHLGTYFQVVQKPNTI